jgi:protein-S-isoprenylcysteine O-methyltransferase Ste14
MRRVAVVVYGGVAYALFVAAFAYTVGFLAGFGVPKDVDDGPTGSAVPVDLALLALFAVQHSGMARQAFKRYVPAAIERSTYVLTSSLVVALLLAQWRPLPATVWSVETGWARALLWTLYAAGWVLVLLSTFLIGHFDVFGLRQVLARAREQPYHEPEFRMPWLYRLVRHPMLVGFFISFWATPDMSAGRLLFAGAASGYILVAVRLEERDLHRTLGVPYQRYAAEVPRFVPRLFNRTGGEQPCEHETPIAKASSSISA